MLRIEDLDTPRTKPGAEEESIELLAALGIDWDDGPVRQSADLGPYEAAMESLAGSGLVYPCELTRKEIEEAASAPHEAAGVTEPTGGSGEARYPVHLRPDVFPTTFDGGREANWRFAAADRDVRFDDAAAGPVLINVARDVGDFVVWTKRREPSYQLAVTVDDARQGVTHVVRGDDLLPSAARQMLLYESLGLVPPDVWVHVPLVVGPDGRRLAKRHGDTRLATYLKRGVRPERVIGLVAAMSGVGDGAAWAEMSAAEFAERFRLDRLPRGPVTFTEEHDAWLTSG